MRDLTDHIETVWEISKTPALCHCSSVLSNTEGSIVVWYEGSYETSSDTVLKISRRSAGSSADWTPPKTLFDFHGAPLGNPVLWRESAEIIHILFSVLTEESWVSSLLFYATSTDFGRSWSRPSLFLSRKGFMAKTQPVRSTSGSLLVPLYHEKEYCPYIHVVEDMEDPRAGTLIAETMARGKAIQPSIARLDNDTLVMLCRTNQGAVWRSLSFNDGMSWSILRPTALPNPDSAVDIIDHNGALIVCHNPSATQRDELRLSYSDDRGETWEPLATIAKGDVEFSYPCMLKDDSGDLHITFTDNRYAIRYLKLRTSEVDRLISAGEAE